MALGMFSSEGVGSLIHINGTVNVNVYRNLLENHVIPSVQASPHQPVIFMHGNAPCHTAKLVKEYLEEENTQVRYELACTKPRLISDRKSLAHNW